MAVPTVSITGNILSPSGEAPTSGRVTARLSAPGSALDGLATVRVGAEVSDDLAVGGAVSLALVPNDNIVPSGTFYLVTIILVLANGRRMQWAERWSVPYTPTPIDVGSVPRLSSSPTTYYTTEAALSQSISLALSNPSGFVVTATGGTAPQTLGGWMADSVQWNGGGPAFDVALALQQIMTRRWDWTPRGVSRALASGLKGDQSEPVTYSRSSNAWVVDEYGVLQLATANYARKNLGGLLIERACANKITAPTAPVNETIAVTVGSYQDGYTCWIEGSGSMTVTAGTVTATGLPLTVVAGEVKAFKVTGNGTVNVTYSGSVSYAQMEQSVYMSDHATTKITTGSYARTGDVASVDVALGARWAVDVVVSIEGGWETSPNPPVRGVWSLGTGIIANTACLQLSANQLQFMINDSAGYGAGTLTLFQATTGWVTGTQKRVTCCADTTTGQMAMYIDGVLATDVPVGSGSGKWTAKPTVLWVGRRAAAGEELDGYIHSLAVNEQSNSPRLCNAESPSAKQIDVALLGDSRMQFAHPYFAAALLTTAYVTQEGWSGDQTSGVLARWTSRVRAQSHRYLVIQVGVNNFGNGWSAAAAWTDLQQVLDESLEDGTRVILTTVFPFKGSPYWTAAAEAEKNTFNASLVTYATTQPRCILVDTATDMDDGTGQLVSAYDSGDHLHLSAAGNTRLVALVSPHLV